MDRRSLCKALVALPVALAIPEAPRDFDTATATVKVTEHAFRNYFASNCAWHLPDYPGVVKVWRDSKGIMFLDQISEERLRFYQRG